jgi:hypothetical protein
MCLCTAVSEARVNTSRNSGQRPGRSGEDVPTFLPTLLPRQTILHFLPPAAVPNRPPVVSRQSVSQSALSPHLPTTAHGRGKKVESLGPGLHMQTGVLTRNSTSDCSSKKKKSRLQRRGAGGGRALCIGVHGVRAGSAGGEEEQSVCGARTSREGEAMRKCRAC